MVIQHIEDCNVLIGFLLIEGADDCDCTSNEMGSLANNPNVCVMRCRQFVVKLWTCLLGENGQKEGGDSNTS